MLINLESIFRSSLRYWIPVSLGALFLWAGPGSIPARAGNKVDFDRDVRRVLAENCFKCHGPDAKRRKGGKRGDGLRLDNSQGARADLGGHAAIVPGHPEKSEMIRRITTSDPDDHMPPPDSGKKLTAGQIALLKSWVEQGARYARHWSYVKPTRPPLPEVHHPDWARNAIDYFILARLESEGIEPSPEADRYALVRRASLDLTGLPPSIEEVDRFVNDVEPGAYERLVDRLLDKVTFGEHWARLWLDEARYADSTGYADDPARTIWGFRDYVIRSLNANKPFDQFTIEQIAGDLLPNPTEEQRIATAFHRNTMTNNEGGTSDEEYRNVAIIDRVNTTMAVWMGTTMGCAQCHDHKYDPITQEDYFRLFAVFNNTEDADRRDESPILTVYTPEQKKQRKAWKTEIARLEKTVQTPTPELNEAQAQWEKSLATDLDWNVLRPSEMKSQAGAAMSLEGDGVIRVAKGDKTDRYTIEAPLPDAGKISALRLEALPDESLPGQGPGYGGGNFVISRLLASVTPPPGTRVSGRYLRVELPGKEKILSLAEVQIFQGADNLALQGAASQSSTDYEAPARLAIDGNTNGDFSAAKSTTHTANSENPWWEVDLKSDQAIDRIVVWNRTDGGLQKRLSGFRLVLLDAKREPVWRQEVKQAPNPNSEFSLSGARALRFESVLADYEQKGFAAAHVLDNKDDKAQGWAVGPKVGQAHQLTLLTFVPAEAPAGSRLTVVIEQLSKQEYHTLGKFRLAMTADARAAEFARTPAAILALLKTPAGQRSDEQRGQLRKYYLSIAPALAKDREQLAGLQKQLKEMVPSTTVPIMRELTGDKRRLTHVQHRGNFLDLGKEVTAGLPPAFQPLTEAGPADRMALARWLVDENNPLTARVVVNRFWESIFGIGIVRTSEEFGAQGEPPSHPQLLDWLATELVGRGWNIKHLLRLMVTSAAYRQSSKVSPELLARDPDNRLLGRGPRFRLSAEMIRDQAMFVSGLLSHKLYGPPVKPAQPKLGLSAAFGSGIDWETSSGEDRYRRAIYTTWRRSNPYPSMSSFDAPNREVCTVKRERTNTPLQALVTLNDPVYVEAAQALARRMAAFGSSPAEKARYGFRLCLARPPQEKELQDLLRLYEGSHARFADDKANALLMASHPLGAVPEGSDPSELAAWTVVGNVLLNLDETLMKR
jgi:Protein of unknown function (DUF1553)/Protein of unknown function (DUF1549)/Planctomycete cytochrome C/NedA-like, galactose-binding domain